MVVDRFLFILLLVKKHKPSPVSLAGLIGSAILLGGFFCLFRTFGGAFFIQKAEASGKGPRGCPLRPLAVGGERLGVLREAMLPAFSVRNGEGIFFLSGILWGITYKFR